MLTPIPSARRALLAMLSLAALEACGGCGEVEALLSRDGGPLIHDAAIVVHDAAAESDVGPRDAAAGDAAGRADASRDALDGSSPDAALPGLSERCSSGRCRSGLFCLDSLLIPEASEEGFCTARCAADRDCEFGALCSPNLGGGLRVCLPWCERDGDCGPHTVCSRRLAGRLELDRGACLPGDREARDGDPCRSFEDCNSDSMCVTSPYEAPGGECRKLGCTPGDDSSCNGGHCMVLDPETTGCRRPCTEGFDCRYREGYGCTVDAQFGSRACGVRHRPVGDGCETAADCGPAPWVCLRQDDWRSAPWPEGYCTVLDCNGHIPACDLETCPGLRACPPDGLCLGARAVGIPATTYCARECGRDEDCRTLAGGIGYLCVPTDPSRAEGPKACVLRPDAGPADAGAEAGGS